MLVKTVRPAVLASVGRAVREAGAADDVTVAERRALRMLAAALAGKREAA